MARTTGNFEHWRLQVSKLEFVIFHCVTLEQQKSDALLRFKTKSDDNTTLDAKCRVLNISIESFIFPPSTERPVLEAFEEPKSAFFLFISELCIVADSMDDEEVEKPTLLRFISAQSKSSDCRPVFCVNQKTEHSLQRWYWHHINPSFPFRPHLEQIVPSTLRANFLYLCH